MPKLYAALAALVLAVIVGGTAVYTWLAPETDCGAGVALGADIGGPFELVTAQGATVTEAEVLDKPSLVYFGYTFCPDVCPFDLARNALAVDLLEDAGHEVGLVFVTIDPARDTPEVLADYVQDMHPRMTALTGSAEQVDAAARAYRVYYAKGTGEGEFYLMDHSTFTYLMVPGQGLATYFKRDDTAEAIAETTACLIAGR